MDNVFTLIFNENKHPKCMKITTDKQKKKKSRSLNIINPNPVILQVHVLARYQ